MLNMVDIHGILIDHFRRDKSISKISRELGLSRKTVRRYVQRHIATSVDPVKELSFIKASDFSYDSSKRKRIKLTQEIQSQIDKYLLDNEYKRNQGLGKQILKSIDIHELLESSGFDISYSTVSHYVSKKQQQSKEAFIKQYHEPGFSCEFDWGEVKLYIKGKLRKYQLAVFTHSSNNYRYARLYNRQDSLCFVDSHIHYFSHIGGVVKEMVYDNMRVAVSKFVGRTHKEPTEALLEMAHYYKFDWRFCNTRKGNEKGNVERSVEYIRRKSFANILEFEDLESANQHLEKILNKINNKKQVGSRRTAIELLEEERKYLFPAPKAYVYYQRETSHVDKFSTIRYQQNHYSVPDNYIGKMLKLHLYPEYIEIFDNDKFICKHERQYTLQTWKIKLEHYIPTLLTKPGALHSSLALRQADQRLKDIYVSHFQDRTKEFIKLLQYIYLNDISISDLSMKVDEIKSLTPNDISLDKIIVLLERKEISQETEDSISNEIELHSQSFLEKATSLYANY